MNGSVLLFRKLSLGLGSESDGVVENLYILFFLLKLPFASVVEGDFKPEPADRLQLTSSVSRQKGDCASFCTPS